MQSRGYYTTPAFPSLYWLPPTSSPTRLPNRKTRLSNLPSSSLWTDCSHLNSKFLSYLNKIYHLIKKGQIGLIFLSSNLLTSVINITNFSASRGFLRENIVFFSHFFCRFSSITYLSVFLYKVSTRTEMGASDNTRYI